MISESLTLSMAKYCKITLGKAFCEYLYTECFIVGTQDTNVTGKSFWEKIGVLSKVEIQTDLKCLAVPSYIMISNYWQCLIPMFFPSVYSQCLFSVFTVINVGY